MASGRSEAMSARGFHVLVVGCGSVGRRHARNLAARECRVSGVDPRPDRRDELASDAGAVSTFASIADALSVDRYDGVVIASPPSLHVEQAIVALTSGSAVLLEKPVAPDLASGERLAEHLGGSSPPLLLGYTWRWWKPLQDVRELLATDALGRILHVRCTLSAHLADWHPWEDYRDFFMASRDLGGGALLDESHWIDLMNWFFGPPDSVFARIDQLSDLEIDTDDNVDLSLGFPGGPRALIHLDLFGRPHEKSISFVGESGTLTWSESPNGYRMSGDGRGLADATWDTHSYDIDRNEMFIGVVDEFIDCMRGDDPVTCNLRDGLAVLRVVEAARESNRTGAAVGIRGAERVDVDQR